MEKSSCAKCGKSANAFCFNCKIVQYCSRECQKADWKLHKTNCRPFEVN